MFIDFFDSLVDKNKKLKDGCYVHKNKRYDAIQMTIHILSLYNECCKKKLTVKNITLYNVVWAYDCDEYSTEEKEAEAFIEEANKTFKSIFKNKGVDFEVKYIKFDDFKKMVNLSEDRKKYLERYTI